MPRAGRVQDWSLTLALDTDLTEVPDWLETFLLSDDVERFVAINEKAKHWHIHVGFTTRRKYTSDYKAWFTALYSNKDERFTTSEHAVELRHHKDILQLVGGYCAKEDDENLRVFGDKGFTAEQLQHGKELYEKSLKRSKIRDAMARLVSVPREQYDAVVGYAMAEGDAENEGSAVGWLIDAGFAFASNVQPHTRNLVQQRYRDNYIRDRSVRDMRPEGATTEL